MKEQSQYVLVECKNWSKPVGTPELIVFRKKLENRAGRCRLGFFVAPGGFTKGRETEALGERQNQHLVVPIGPEDLEELVASPNRNDVLKKFHGRAAMAGNGHNGNG